MGRIEPLTRTNNFILVYCADLLSPVIGDQLFGYRVRLVSGKKVRVSPQQAPDANSKVQNLPQWMLQKIALNPGEEHVLPLHLHLGRVHFPRFFGKSRDLTIRALPRPYFLGTAEMLGINVQNEI